MKKRLKVLLASFAVLSLGHGLITLYHNKGLAGGDYFSSGIILMSDGLVVQTSQRLYSDGPELYSYNQVGSDSYELQFSREYSPKGYIAYINQTLGAMAKGSLARYTDRDISFNSSYMSRPGAKLTLSELRTPYQAKCWYVYEVSSVHCYSAKRSDAP
ncbi:hypothetical protein P3C24_26690 [Pseudomonas proteolytica]|uniref:hypothetical protein n=1 Tax=Pseudomonas proteolytica TaxID=219574 RepID=UPI0023DF4BA7|nr:hypothetical protein [Pseudomonas proteolytica]MDF3164526.1 hypothetical protein [Pseudomonas proteolytica]